MQIVKTSELKERMVTAAPVCTKGGRLIVDKGVSLTNALIASIAFYDIAQVETEDEQEPARPVQPPGDRLSYSERITSSARFLRFQADYAQAVSQLKSIFASILEEKKEPDTEACRQLMQPLLTEVPTSIELFDFLHNMRTNNDSIFAHSLNVALLSNMLGRWLKMPESELTLLGMAALLHDIGKSRIPAEILDKPEKYTDSEFLLVQKHPEFGYEILLPFENLDPCIKNTALMHHERCNGKGYPGGLTYGSIDDFAQLLAIADVYDAMTAARTYRTPLCPFQVIADFEIEGLQQYNPQYILTFLEHIAYTYQNNRVVLTDGRSADILMLNKQFLSRPIVETDSGIVDLSKMPDLRIRSLI